MRHWLMAFVATLGACLSPQSPSSSATVTSGRTGPESSSLSGLDPEARTFALSILEPVFAKYVSNVGNTDPIGLSSRVRRAYLLIKAGKISLQYSAVPRPQKAVALFSAGFDADNNRPSITAHVPHLRERAKSERPEGLTDVVAVSIAHEVIHLEVCRHSLGYHHTNYEIQVEEAATWGITIIEVVRPLAALGRIPYYNMMTASHALAKLSDDYRHPAWVQGFAEMIDITAPDR